jgi:hypothetical protein
MSGIGETSTLIVVDDEIDRYFNGVIDELER